MNHVYGVLIKYLYKINILLSQTKDKYYCKCAKKGDSCRPRKGSIQTTRIYYLNLLQLQPGTKKLDRTHTTVSICYPINKTSGWCVRKYC